MRWVFLGGALLLASLGVIFNWGEAFELTTLDWRYQYRPAPKVNDKIVIVEIAEDSLQKIGQWPISREWYSQFVQALQYSGVRSVFFGILFVEPKEEDRAFARAMVEMGSVYLPVVIQQDSANVKPVLPVEPLYSAARGLGHINVTPDLDGKIRRVPWVMGDYPMVSYLMVRDGSVPEPFLFLPLDERGNLLINFAGGWTKTFRHYSFIDVLSSYAQELKGEEPKINLENLRGAVCFVGLTAAGTQQALPTPIERHYPLIGIHANIYNTLIERQFLQRGNLAARISISWLFLFLGLWIPRLWVRIQGLFILMGVAVLYFLISWFLFARFGLWLDWVYPLSILGLSSATSFTRAAIVEQHQQELLERELNVAAQIQQVFLPSPIPEVPPFSVAAKMIPARHIGGDFYDIVPIGSEAYAFMIGDVSGKGVPAALCMAVLLSEFRTLIHKESQPAGVLTELNRILWERKLKVFVTMTLLVYEKISGRLSYANAGHLPLLKANQQNPEVVILEFPSGPPLGATPQGEFPETELPLEKDSLIVLYTDGVVEAKNKKGEFLGIEPIRQEISRQLTQPSPELLDSLIARVMEFQAGTIVYDDLTLLVINFKGRGIIP